MADEAQSQAPRTLERHATAGVAGILLAMVLWTGNTLLEVRDKLSRIEGRLAATDLREQAVGQDLGSLRARVRDLELDGARQAAAAGSSKQR